MQQFKYILLLTSILLLSTSCDYISKFKDKAAKVNRYEKVSLHLAKKNRELKAEINKLNFEVQSLKSQNHFLALKLKGNNRAGRSIASIPSPIDIKNDLVKYDTYKWSEKELLLVARTEFNKKNYEKSAQFFQIFISKHPKSKMLSDEVLFQSSIASYESGRHYNWTKNNLKHLISKYPNSKYYRGAKLWKALANLKSGNRKAFYSTVEEFRKKYRNTSEWKILSAHYEKLVRKYKN